MRPKIDHDPEDVLRSVVEWAEQRESIRAVLLTSTRTVPNAPMDDLSDYDVILFVEEVHPFHEDQGWLEYFGEVLVAYWDPIYPDPDYGLEKFGNVTQYSDGLKIDFTVCPVDMLNQIVQAPTLPAELDAGYRILLDKDHLTEGLRAPTYKSYVPTPPSNETYQKTVNDFFSDPPNVAKCLLRGELLPLKWCLDYDMKHVYLRQLLEWKVGLDYNWSIPVGALGKALKKRLPPEMWSQLEKSYAGADVAQNWEALFHTMSLFRQVAMEVGNKLGYAYPLELDERVTAYVKEMHSHS
jgi:aminoglycoside 6-adenylyltransferase